MTYVIIEFAGEETRVHGVFLLEYAALKYLSKLESKYPSSDFLLTEITPEKNIPNIP
jgi:hypothetical protein